MCEDQAVVKAWAKDEQEILLRYTFESKQLSPFEEVTKDLKMIACGPSFILGLIRPDSAL